MAGIQYPLWFEKWFVDISGYYNWYFYNCDAIGNRTGDRTDEQKTVIFMIFGQLCSNLYLNLMYQPIWNSSNILNQYFKDPYNYNKSLLSCYLTYSF